MEKQQVKLNDHIAYRVLDNEAIIINTKSSDVIVLNDVGSVIIKLIDENKNIDEIPEIIQKEYSEEVSLQLVHDDVKLFITELIEKNILVEL